MAGGIVSRWPDEVASRRAGWNEGQGIRLADGEVWHLPRIDDDLVPYLDRLCPLGMMAGKTLRALRDEPSRATVDAVARYFPAFVGQVLRCQYDLSHQQASDLAFGRKLAGFDREGLHRLMRDLEVFAGRLTAFTGRRFYPASAADN